MGKFVLTDAYITINGTDLSDHIDSVTITQTKAAVESTGMGSGGGRERIGGLSDDTIELEIQNDYASASVHAVLSPLQANSTEFPIVVRAFASAVSETNPQWAGTGILFDYTPLDGKIGDLMTTKPKINIQRAPLAVTYA